MPTSLKIPRLPETDLARIAPLPRDQKYLELRRVKLGRPPYSYSPVKKNILDILNISPGPLVELARTPWEKVAAQIIRACKRSEDEIQANLRAGEGLYHYATQHNLVGRQYEFRHLAIGLSERLSYWWPMVSEIDGRPTVAFFDPRRSKKLTAIGRKFVFSAMHQHIRVPDPDFAEFRLAVAQFKNTPTGPRPVVMHFDDGQVLWEFDALDAMVRETYEIWREIQVERLDEKVRRGSSSGGLF